MYQLGIMGDYCGSVLEAVPAVHFNYIFAEEVNRLCRSPQSTPQAIAVELGPEMCGAVESWMRELGVADSPTPLPVMLALLKKNRMIRPSFREKVLELQSRMGMDLTEMDPDTLYHEFGYAGMELIYLSPVDSIIEAIRCGLELNVPVYGVDLDEFPNYGYRDSSIVMEDPLSTHARSLADYIEQNAPVTEICRDDEIDDRREFAMAARLKALLSRYKRVLFTGGMAHYVQIRRLLKDPIVLPSSKIFDPPENSIEVKRVVVHPVRAVNGQMDPFPEFVRAYQETRQSASAHQFLELSFARPEASTLLDQLIEKTCSQYFCYQQDGSARHARDLDSISGFRAYLNNLGLVNLISVPSTYLIIKVASEIMSAEFAEALAHNLMDFPWATPKDFPDCGVVLPEENSHPGQTAVKIENWDIKRGYISSRSHTSFSHSPAPFPKDYLREWMGPQMIDPMFFSHSWLPWERITTLLSYSAASGPGNFHKTGEALESEIGLLEDVHLRATIRSYSRGSDRIYIHDQQRHPRRNISIDESFPVVWILDSRPEQKPQWLILIESAVFLQDHLDGKPIFRQKILSGLSEMVAVAGYGSDKELDILHENKRRSWKSYCYKAMIVFSPLCWTRRQHAQWCEHSKCARNPFLRAGGPHVDDFFCETSMHYGDSRFRTLKETVSPAEILMLAALPYSHYQLTVVAPKDFIINPAVYQEAARLKKTIRQVPIEKLPDNHVQRLATCQLVPIREYDPSYVYPPGIAESIGEEPGLYMDMIPEVIRNFHA